MSEKSQARAVQQWLAFRVGDEEYGVDLLQVQEIRSYETPTRIASAPEYVNGVLDLRGDVVPIIDLRRKLGLQNKGYDAATVTIMLRLAHGVVGMVVEGVTDVVNLQPQHLRAVPPIKAGPANDYLLAMGVQEERSLILVDAQKLMGTSAVDAPSCAPA